MSACLLLHYYCHCHLTKELKDAGTGLLLAAVFAMVPTYIFQSVTGSYDNEGIAIFCILLTYNMWIKAVKTGCIYWEAKCALACLYMDSSWWGVVFLINLIPLSLLVLMLTGCFSHWIYMACCTVYCLGTILSMQTCSVAFQPVFSSECMETIGVFGLGLIHVFLDYLCNKLNPQQIEVLFQSVLSLAGLILLAMGALFTLTEKNPSLDRAFLLTAVSFLC